MTLIVAIILSSRLLKAFLLTTTLYIMLLSCVFRLLVSATRVLAAVKCGRICDAARDIGTRCETNAGYLVRQLSTHIGRFARLANRTHSCIAQTIRNVHTEVPMIGKRLLTYQLRSLLATHLRLQCRVWTAVVR